MSSQRKNRRVDASGSGRAHLDRSGGDATAKREAAEGTLAGADRIEGWERLAPWVGSLVLHGVLGVMLVAWGSEAAVEPMEEVTSGSWAGTIFEVGLTSTEGVEGARPVARAAEAAASAEQPPAAVDEVGVELETNKEAPRAVVPEQSQPAEKAAEEVRAPSASRPPVDAQRAATSRPSDGVRRPAPASQLAPGPNSGRQAGSSGEAQRETSGEPEASSDEVRGPGGGGEAVGLGGDRATARLGQLPAAWTRALPAAARGDATWHELEPGLVGRWLVLAKLDEQGALTSLRVESGSRPFVERLLRVSQALLRAGRFALPAGSSGEHRLGLEVWIDRGGEASPEGAPQLVRQLASRYPTTEEPGEALVVFNSGRRVQLRVYLEPPW